MARWQARMAVKRCSSMVLNFLGSPRRLLIRKIRLFALKSFMNLRDVTVGLQDKAIVIASGQWRFTLPVEVDARFPNVDRVW